MARFIIYYGLISFAFAFGTFPAFGWFFAREEQKSRVVGVSTALAALLLPFWLSGLPLGFLVLQGIVAFASFYVADRKNRSRAIWTISTLLLGAPLFAFLLFLPAKSAERTSLQTLFPRPDCE